MAIVTIDSATTVPPPKARPECLLGVLVEWGSTWMWDSLRMVGDDNWIEESICAGTCHAVTGCSYTKDLYPDMCSAAFVLEYTEGRGMIVGSFLKSSTQVYKYRGERLGLMAIHIIILVANKVDTELRVQVTIYSDCLGALTRVITFPANRSPTRCKHSDIPKNIMVHSQDLMFKCAYSHVKTYKDENRFFQKLEQIMQLNCLLDKDANNVIWGWRDFNRHLRISSHWNQ